MYQYASERPKLFTEEGSRIYVAARDAALRLLEKSGAFRLQEMMSIHLEPHVSDSWMWLALVDRMVETGDIREITMPGVAGQHRVFVSAKG